MKEKRRKQESQTTASVNTYNPPVINYIIEPFPLCIWCHFSCQQFPIYKQLAGHLHGVCQKSFVQSGVGNTNSKTQKLRKNYKTNYKQSWLYLLSEIVCLQIIFLSECVSQKGRPHIMTLKIAFYWNTVLTSMQITDVLLFLGWQAPKLRVIKLFCSEILITFKQKENPKPLECLTAIFMMRSSYVSYMYPDTECKTTYVPLAAKTAAVIPLKAFSFSEPSLTPSSLPSNKFFLKSVEGGQRGRAGTPPLCSSASSWRFERRQRCLLRNIPADTGARTLTGVLGKAQWGQSSYPHRVQCPGCWPCTVHCPCSQARGHSPPLCCSGLPSTLCLPLWIGSMQFSYWVFLQRHWTEGATVSKAEG